MHCPFTPTTQHDLKKFRGMAVLSQNRRVVPERLP